MTDEDLLQRVVLESGESSSMICDIAGIDVFSMELFELVSHEVS